EAKGFVIAAGALLFGILADRGADAVSAGLGADWNRWRIPLRALETALALGLPVVLGAWWVGIPTGDLLGPSRAPLRDFTTGVVAARGGSVLAGIAYWMAFFAGVSVWLDVLPER